MCMKVCLTVHAFNVWAQGLRLLFCLFSISAVYSLDMRLLVDDLLKKDPSQRPTVKALLQRPILARLVDTYLTPAQKKEEFDHSVLHGFNQKDIARLAQQNRANAIGAVAAVAAPARPVSASAAVDPVAVSVSPAAQAAALQAAMAAGMDLACLCVHQ
jgi:hypothetical protein